MKNIILLITLFSLLFIGNYTTNAQSDSILDTSSVDTVESIKSLDNYATNEDTQTESQSFHQIIKEKFIQGGPGFMGIVLICLILGLALCIERIIYLNLATTNTDKLLLNVENAM